MSSTVRICNKRRAGNVWVAGTPLAPGEFIDLPADEAKQYNTEGLVHEKIAVKQGGGAPPTDPPKTPVTDPPPGNPGEPPSDPFAEYPDTMSRDQATEIAIKLGVAKQDFHEMLTAGKVIGAVKDGTRANSPWKVSKAGLLETLKANG